MGVHVSLTMGCGCQATVDFEEEPPFDGSPKDLLVAIGLALVLDGFTELVATEHEHEKGVDDLMTIVVSRRR